MTQPRSYIDSLGQTDASVPYRMPIPLILASSSPRRCELLAALGVEFTVLKPAIDEVRRAGETPLDYVRRLSLEKAHAAAAQVASSAAILAADTVVILAADTIGIEAHGELLEKPRDADDARAMLRRLRGRPHTVCTAITLLVVNQDDAGAGREPLLQISDLVSTTVYMRDYSDEEIEAYIATGDPFDKAGSYAIQHEGFHPVERIEGSYTNVVGLPLEAVRRALDQIGWPPDGSPP